MITHTYQLDDAGIEMYVIDHPVAFSNFIRKCPQAGLVDPDR